MLDWRRGLEPAVHCESHRERQNNGQFEWIGQYHNSLRSLPDIERCLLAEMRGIFASPEALYVDTKSSEHVPRIVYASGGCPRKSRRVMPRAVRRTLLSAVLFGTLLFCETEIQAAGNLWVYQSCANWVRYHSLETAQGQMPTSVARLGRCSLERMRMACRLAVAGAPVQGLKLCPDELCPTIGRALRGLGVAAMPRGQLLTVYRLCPQQW